MATDFNLSVVAPDRTVVDSPVSAVTAPGYEGYFGVMAGHEPMLVALRPGILEYRDQKDNRVHVAIGGGFMEVSGSQCIVLADDARIASEIDIKETEARLEMARKALRGEDSSMTQDEATAEIERAMVRIKAARNAQ